jgi:hypothetical protein
MLTENIFTLSDAEFDVDLLVGFFAKHAIINHGSLLKVHDIVWSESTCPSLTR